MEYILTVRRILCFIYLGISMPESFTQQYAGPGGPTPKTVSYL